MRVSAVDVYFGFVYTKRILWLKCIFLKQKITNYNAYNSIIADEVQWQCNNPKMKYWSGNSFKTIA